MSGDVQPRKRKDKRRKKDVPLVGLQPEYIGQKVPMSPPDSGSEDVLSNFSPDETIHIHKDSHLGGNICAKIIFFCLLGALAVTLGLVVIEYRGSSDVELPIESSKWGALLNGWTDDAPAHHDDEPVLADSHEEGSHEEGSHEEGSHEEGSHEEGSHEEGSDEAGSGEQSSKEAEQDVTEEEDDDEASQEANEDDSSNEQDQESEEQTESNEDQSIEESSKEQSEEDESKEQSEEEEEEEDASAELEDIPGVTESVENDDDEEDNNSEESGEDGKEEDELEQADEPVDEVIEVAEAFEDGEASDDEAADEEAAAEPTGAPTLSQPPPPAESSPEESEGEEEEASDDEPAPVPTPVVPPRTRGGPREVDSSDIEEIINEASPIETQETCQRESDSNKCGGVSDETQTTTQPPPSIQAAFSEELDLADEQLNQDPATALPLFETILKEDHDNVRALLGKANSLDKLAAAQRSNALLQQAIVAYKQVLLLGNGIDDQRFLATAAHCIERMRFKGDHMNAVSVHLQLMERFPNEAKHYTHLAVTYLMINRMLEARAQLVRTLKKWPDDGLALVLYGFILKTADNNLHLAVDYLTRGIASRAEGTQDGRFYFQLSDALLRLGRSSEAATINRLGVTEGLFLSEYQRSLYNVDRLKSTPWWTQEDTSYKSYFQKLEDYWLKIKDEGLRALNDKKNNLFQDESENLKDKGDWKQFELFSRGRRMAKNCAHTPITCQLIAEFPAAKDCQRGQVKFSMMEPGTHVFPHCGPTNCRLRAHLGLIVPPKTAIRVAEETRNWQEGKVIIFDDSFEHEVWHNGTTLRLVLIVDVWHPQLTSEERKTLPAI